MARYQLTVPLVGTLEAEGVVAGVYGCIAIG